MTPEHAARIGSSLSTVEWMVILGIILVVIQFLYKLWDRKDTKVVLEAFQRAVASFEPHIEYNRRSYVILKDLKRMHDQHDEEGRPMWFMPREMLEMQRQLVQITSTFAKIQEQQTSLMIKLEDKIDLHQAQCAKQFSHLDKKTENMGAKT